VEVVAIDVLELLLFVDAGRDVLSQLIVSIVDGPWLDGTGLDVVARLRGEAGACVNGNSRVCRGTDL
jgi:hypothetical protein